MIKNDERIPPKRVLMGNFIIQDQWQNQEQDGRTSFGGKHDRFYEYEVRETSRKQRRMEASSEEDQGPEWAVAP